VGEQATTFVSKNYLVLLRCELGPERAGARSKGGLFYSTKLRNARTLKGTL